MSPETLRQRLDIVIDLLQSALEPVGCKLSSWAAEVLLYKALRTHQMRFKHKETTSPDPLETLGKPWDELVDTLAPVVAHLAEGLRERHIEYRLVALLYDRWGGVQDMSVLQARMDKAFASIVDHYAICTIRHGNGVQQE